MIKPTFFFFFFCSLRSSLDFWILLFSSFDSIPLISKYFIDKSCCWFVQSHCGNTKPKDYVWSGTSYGSYQGAPLFSSLIFAGSLDKSPFKFFFNCYFCFIKTKIVWDITRLYLRLTKTAINCSPILWPDTPWLNVSWLAIKIFQTKEKQSYSSKKTERDARFLGRYFTVITSDNYIR